MTSSNQSSNNNDITRNVLEPSYAVQHAILDDDVENDQNTESQDEEIRQLELEIEHLRCKNELKKELLEVRKESNALSEKELDLDIEENYYNRMKKIAATKAASIQTENQYPLVYKTIFEYMHAKKISKAEVAEFIKMYEEYLDSQSQSSFKMAQLNRDLLREVFLEIVQTTGFKNIDKFMMAGREPFQLVLDHCMQANGVVIFKDEVVAKFPQIAYTPPSSDSDIDSDDEDYEEPILGTEISTNMKLFKPISRALATTITSLDICGFSPALIPMLLAIDREMEDVLIQDSFDPQLKDILEACVNIPNVQNSVTIRFGYKYNFADGMKFFAIPCHKLTIKNVDFDTVNKEINLDNSHLHNIRDLAIHGNFRKNDTIREDLKEFAAFLSTNFPNLETLNLFFELNPMGQDYFWDWNDNEMANCFKALPPGIKGSMCFKIINYDLKLIDSVEFPDVQEEDGEEYYKIFPISDTLNFKLAYWYDVKAHESDSDYYYDSDDYHYGSNISYSDSNDGSYNYYSEFNDS